jgi:hypothetical protein
MAKRKCPECKTNIGPNGYCFSCKKTTADNIMKKASTELRFASEGEALQYLSDVTGKKIKIAGDLNLVNDIKKWNITERDVEPIWDAFMRVVKNTGAPMNVVMQVFYNSEWGNK